MEFMSSLFSASILLVLATSIIFNFYDLTKVRINISKKVLKNTPFFSISFFIICGLIYQYSYHKKSNLEKTKLASINSDIDYLQRVKIPNFNKTFGIYDSLSKTYSYSSIEAINSNYIERIQGLNDSLKVLKQTNEKFKFITGQGFVDEDSLNQIIIKLDETELKINNFMRSKSNKWVIVLASFSKHSDAIKMQNDFNAVNISASIVYRNNRYRLISTIFENENQAVDFLNANAKVIKSNIYIVDFSKWCPTINYTNNCI